MGVLGVAFLVVAVLAAAATLGWMFGEYDEVVAEIERDGLWHAQWHERIWEERHDGA